EPALPRAVLARTGLLYRAATAGGARRVKASLWSVGLCRGILCPTAASPQAGLNRPDHVKHAGRAVLVGCHRQQHGGQVVSQFLRGFTAGCDEVALRAL